MTWETAYGLVVFSSVWALISAAKQFRVDENDDGLTGSIKSLFKTVFIGSALIISAVGIGNMENVINASFAASAGDTTVATFIEANTAIYAAVLNTYIIFIFFLLLFIIFMIFRNLQKNG